MNSLNTAPTLSGSLPINVTIGSNLPVELDELPTFRHEDILSEHNRKDSDQTQVYYVNGTSNAFRIDLGQFLLSEPPLPKTQEFFRAIQKWEGHVIEADGDIFLARLVPIVGEGTEQEAEIYIEEVDQGDRMLIAPGAVFYWSIGYLDRPSGRLRASILRFRRLPVWTKPELQSAEAAAARLKSLLNAE